MVKSGPNVNILGTHYLPSWGPGPNKCLKAGGYFDILKVRRLLGRHKPLDRGFESHQLCVIKTLIITKAQIYWFIFYWINFIEPYFAHWSTFISNNFFAWSPPPHTTLPWTGRVEEGHRPTSDTTCCGCGCGVVRFLDFAFIKINGTIDLYKTQMCLEYYTHSLNAYYSYKTLTCLEYYIQPLNVYNRS